MRLSTLICCLILPTSGFAQNLFSYDTPANLDAFLRDATGEFRKKTGEAYGTIGSPNVYEEFRDGNVYFTNKSVARHLPINYDCYNDRVLLSKGDVDYILDKRMIDYLEFDEGNDGRAVYKQVFVIELKKTVFMKLLYNRKSNLYMHIYKSFQKADYTGPYNPDKRYDEYHDNFAWYVELSGKKLVQLRPKKKAILRQMDPYGMEIEKFLKKEKPDLKTEEGLIQLVEYYDELSDSN